MDLAPRPLPGDARLLPLAEGGGAAEAGSCACCAPTGGGAVRTDAGAEPSVTEEYRVAGMTCGNCVSHVTADLSALDGVRGVEVELVAGGVSTVRVLSDAAIDPSLVAETVADGGYEVVPA